MNTVNSVPFLDLVAPHREMEAELTEVFRTALQTAGFVGGPTVQRFEDAFAGFCGSSSCVGVGSGTDAVRFALIAAGVKPGDVVITVPNTFIATTEAISQAGAVPDFVDIDERTYNLDPEKLRKYLETSCHFDVTSGSLTHRKTGRPVTAIIPVHLYGQMCDMDPILELAEQYRLMVVEDACQAHGAEYFSRKHNQWKRAGSMGCAAAFSFYPGKNLGACGEAGAVTTSDPDIARTVRILRDHGQPKKYYHDVEGYNGRIDAIQAGILATKLRYLSEWNERRRQNAACYHQLFQPASDSVVVPYEPSWTKAVYHLYVIRVERRDDVKEELGRTKIATGIHYPIPLHLQRAYRNMGYKDGDFPVTERVAAEILSLPMYPQLRIDQQRHVAQKVMEIVLGHSTHLPHPKALSAASA